MKHKGLTILLVICSLCIAGSALLFVNRPASAPVKQIQKSSEDVAQNVAAHAVDTDKVLIQNYNFTPAVIRVAKNTSVIWTNNDTAPHTLVVSDGDTKATSDTLNFGASYSFVFDQVGTFSYHFAMDADTKGTVIVTD